MFTEECFWILVYIIEDLMPRDYYTNMLSLRADIQIVTNMLALKDRRLLEHFKKVGVELSFVMVEAFLTMFTNTCHPDLAAIIIDHLFAEGATVLIKAMMLLLSYVREELLKVNSFGRCLFIVR